MRTHKNYRKEIITLEILSKAIANSMGIKKEEAKGYANFILDIFGYNDRIIDNVLEREERQIFYHLEDVGLVKSETEFHILYDGREWRTFFWNLEKENIFLYASGMKKKVKSKRKEKKKEIKNIYFELPEEAWYSRKSFGE